MMNENKVNPIGMTIRLGTGFDDALALTIEALKAEGFGVLTEIDVQDTLKKKIGVDFPRYKILGACNPTLAHRALTIAPEVGLLLPCNVTVREVEVGVVEVALVDPLSMLGVVSKTELQPVADEAAARMKRVLEALLSTRSITGVLS